MYIKLEPVPGTNLLLSNDGKVYCFRKQREPSMGLQFTKDQLQVGSTTHCAIPTLVELPDSVFTSI